MDESLFRIGRALEAIEANLGRPTLSVDELADAAGYSFWHFQRLFAAVMGEPVAGYVRRRRLTEAARALKADRERRVIDVALACGFESHEAFARTFRAVTGMTPSGYRARAKGFFAWIRMPVAPVALKLLPMNKKIETEIVELPARSVAGLAGHFISAASPDANNFEVIPPLWRALFDRAGEVGAERGAVAYGVCRCLPPNQRSREDELEYLAGFEVAADFTPPAGMVRWDLPAQRCARFVHRGPIAKFPETLAFVYGAWFPRSEYEPAIGTGYELESYDGRFKVDAPDSELDYFVPVRANGGAG